MSAITQRNWSGLVIDALLSDRSVVFVLALLPAFRAVDCALPARPTALSLRLRHVRLELSVTRGVDFLERLGFADVPSGKPNRRAREQGGAERGALSHFRPNDVETAEVGEDGHALVAIGHAAVNLEVEEIRLGVELHALDDGPRLEGVGLERRTRNVSRRGVRGNA